MRLLHVDGDEEALLGALLFEAAGVGEEEARIRLSALGADERARMLTDLVGERRNRRHRPGRGLEALRYRFEIVSDYGAFRDLQRHRMLTVQWQRLTPHLGAEVPEEVEAAGCGDAMRRAFEVSRGEWERLTGAGREREALYALCLGYRIRYVLDLNAREAMQLIELRSGREGHPSYRAVAHEMHRLIGTVHPAVAGAMRFVDTSAEPRLERILSEMRTQAKLDALAGGIDPMAPTGTLGVVDPIEAKAAVRRTRDIDGWFAPEAGFLFALLSRAQREHGDLRRCRGDRRPSRQEHRPPAPPCSIAPASDWWSAISSAGRPRTSRTPGAGNREIFLANLSRALRRHRLPRRPREVVDTT